MAGNSGPSRYALEMDEKSGVPMCVYWTTEEMADWICEVGYPQYRECMERNFITGRHLICLDASRLPDLGITDFEHVKDISAKIRSLIDLDHIIKNMSVSMSNPMIAYLELKRRTGRITQNTYYKAFINKNKRWYK